VAKLADFVQLARILLGGKSTVFEETSDDVLAPAAPTKLGRVEVLEKMAKSCQNWDQQKQGLG